MSYHAEHPRWWELHLRQARGEPLTAAEQQEYAEALADQDRDEELSGNLAALQHQRAELLAREQANALLRSRIEQLQREIHAVEHALSAQTRKLLGVGE